MRGLEEVEAVVEKGKGDASPRRDRDLALNFDIQRICAQCLGFEGDMGGQFSEHTLHIEEGLTEIDRFKKFFLDLIHLLGTHVAILNNPAHLESTRQTMLKCYDVAITELHGLGVLDSKLFPKSKENYKRRFHIHLTFSNIKSTLKSYKRSIKLHTEFNSTEALESEEMLTELLYKIALCQDVLGFTTEFRNSQKLSETTQPTPGQKDTLVRWLKSQRYRYHFGWNNFMHSFPINNAIVVEINTEEEVCALVKKVRALNQGKPPTQRLTIRAASGYTTTFSIAGLFPFTQQGMLNKYAASFSGTRGAISEVVVRFSPRFQNHIRVHDHPDHPTVDVPAGVQIEKLDNFLWETGRGFSLTTASMIRWVTAVGLASNAGHGTGKDEPAFSGLIKLFRICDFQGDIYEIEEIGEKDNASYVRRKLVATNKFVQVDDNCKEMFEAIRGAHLGLFGIVLNVRLKCVPKYNLKDERIPFRSVDDMAETLRARMFSSKAMTVFAFAPYKTATEQERAAFPHLGHLPADQHPFALCLWSDPSKTEVEQMGIQEPEKFFWKFKHEVLVDSGNSLFDLLDDFPHLTTLFMHFAAAVELGTHPKTYIGESRHVVHSIPTYPNKITGCSFLLPVTEQNCADTVLRHLNFINTTLLRYASRGEFPVSLATYVRFFKGTNGGLSTSSTLNDSEYTISVETFTQRDNPSFPKFRAELVDYFTHEEPRVKFHLGKYIPEDMSFQGIYTPAEFNKFFEQLVDWHGNLDNFEHSPFLNPFLASKLFDHKEPRLAQLPEPKTKPSRHHLLQTVIKHLDKMEQTGFREYGATKDPHDSRRAALQPVVANLRGELQNVLNTVQQDTHRVDDMIKQSTKQSGPK